MKINTINVCQWWLLPMLYISDFPNMPSVDMIFIIMFLKFFNFKQRLK